MASFGPWLCDHLGVSYVRWDAFVYWPGLLGKGWVSLPYLHRVWIPTSYGAQGKGVGEVPVMSENKQKPDAMPAWLCGYLHPTPLPLPFMAPPPPLRPTGAPADATGGAGAGAGAGADAPAGVAVGQAPKRGCVTALSGLPASQWQTLPVLELIYQRNKPAEAPKVRGVGGFGCAGCVRVLVACVFCFFLPCEARVLVAVLRVSWALLFVVLSPWNLLPAPPPAFSPPDYPCCVFALCAL